MLRLSRRLFFLPPLVNLRPFASINGSGSVGGMVKPNSVGGMVKPNLLQGRKFAKILGPNYCNNGFYYQLGLNQLPPDEPFQGHSSCMPGGLYFTTDDYLYKYLLHGIHYARLTVPSDALVYRDPNDVKWKADKIFIHEIAPVRDFHKWTDPEWCRKVLHEFSSLSWEYDEHAEFASLFQHFRLPEAELLKFFRDNDLCLGNFKNPSDKLILQAVKQNGYNLQYVRHERQTEAMCVAAVANWAGALDHMAPRFHNTNVYQAAVMGSEPCEALRIMKWQTHLLCFAAIRNNPDALKFVRRQTEYLCLEAVKRRGLALRHVREQTPAICMAAVQQDGAALPYVREQTFDICMAAVRNKGFSLFNCKIKDKRILLAALKQNPKLPPFEVDYYENECPK